MIIDVLALDIRNAHQMMEDIETTCGFVRTKLGDAMGIMEITEADYIRRLKDSMSLLANELRRRIGNNEYRIDCGSSRDSADRLRRRRGTPEAVVQGEFVALGPPA